MGNITVRFVGGPLDGRIEERESASPITFSQLDPSTINWSKTAAEIAPFELGHNEFQYWLIPTPSGTWEAFEKPVWDALQAHIRSAEERHQRIRRRAHEALDSILGT